MSVNDEDVGRRVRANLRALRTARGLTLAEVAASAGMATSTLSRLESGARQLTLAHLAPLARALAVSTDALLSSPDGDPRVGGAPVADDGVTFWPITGPGADGARAFTIVVSATPREPVLRTHPGHQWLHVVSGRLRLLLGDREFALGPGEAADFSTLVPHWMGAVHEPVERLTISGHGGERVRLRATAEAP